jgi:glycosyltransferase involved in cell wall biosynthesis
MWDIKWTCKEIDDSNSNLIVCHHKNDWEKYVELYKNKINRHIIYLLHHANPEIFYNQYLDKNIDILIAGVIKERNYPLKYRISQLVKKYLQQYRVHILQHPGYNIDDAYTDKIQKEFAYYINRSKLVISCTSSYNYRLGKYVEIPMCGGVIVGDIPYEEQDDFRKFIVEVNMEMQDAEIVDKIKMVLENRELLLRYSLIGEAWAQKYTTKKYVNELYNQLVSYKKHPRVYIISDEIKNNHPEFKNEKWICDELKKEFTEYFGQEFVITNAENADIIWYLAPWNYGYTPIGITRDDWLEILKNKKVVFTMHHIDENKYNKGKLDKIFEFMWEYGTKWHAICEKTHDFLKNMAASKDIAIPIIKEYLWVDSEIFFEIQDKNSLREKWGLSGYIVGSFQKDTEGKTNEPKMSKGPDIFVNIVEDLYINHPDLLVVLSGIRRTYIISELEKRGIPFKYFEMIRLNELNEIYNCLDLYVVSSRVEGGPRAVFEAGITKTPIISTDVGIASEFMQIKSIYDVNDWESYKNARPRVEETYLRVSELEKKKQILKIKDMLIL